MSTSVSSSSAPTPGKRGSSLRRWVIGISVVLISLGLFLFIKVQGHVTGLEFSPTHFQLRKFSFYEIPLLRVQITPITRTGSTPSTALYVRQNSLIKPTAGPPDTWHLVSINRGLTGTTPADAKLLLDQLNIESAGSAYWRQWSIDQTQHAQVLWPVIQKLAERELYIVMPKLFELAQLEQTPEQLAIQIDDFLRQEYSRLIEDMRAAKRPELANQLLEEALQDYPDDSGLKKLNSTKPAPPAS
ncbi:MAG: hypothetical protein MI861_19025 [Pirellulales bacterium]|nr:hypothetical protein [Pirellulales bacterium]